MWKHTSTRAGRVGDAIERKSRAGAWLLQNGQVSASVSDTGPAVSATGASQRLQASVPVPSRPDLVARRSDSWAPATGVLRSSQTRFE